MQKSNSSGGFRRHKRRPFGKFSNQKPGFKGGFGGSNGSSNGGSGGAHNFRRPMQKSRRVMGSTINVDQLINRVNSDVTVPQEQKEPTITHSFSDFAADPRILNNIKRKGYLTPTPIQDQAIPVGLQGRDVIGLANTGTGKTAAFLIPLINKMLADRSQRALILAPTRELAQQISEELRDFALGLNIYAVLCIGGTNIGKQINALKHPQNFVIGTPGRIIDLIKRRLIRLETFKNVVVDESDRMVDMGFINDIRFILEKLPKQRQSFCFTATLDKDVETLVRQFLIDPVKISVKMRDTAANIRQDIIRVPQDKRAKMNILIEHLAKPGFDKVLVFGRTKHGVDKVMKALFASGIKADSIHGNKSQSYRQKALTRFKKGEVKVLVATDVAARGLDISNVSHVINFDIPANYDDYIHRIGRTGRAEKSGTALTFVS